MDVRGPITGILTPGMTVTGFVSKTKARILYVGAPQPGIPNTAFISVHRVAGPGFVGNEQVQSDLNPTNFITVLAITPWGGGPGPGNNGTLTILQFLQSLLAAHTTVVLDSTDGIITTQTPVYTTETGANVLGITKDMLGRTKVYSRVRADGFLHLGTVATDPATTNTYSADRTFTDLRDNKLVLPTRIVVFNSKAGLTSTESILAAAEDNVATAQYGLPVTKFIDIEVQSNAEAAVVADSLLRRSQLEASTGTIKARMNCGQELWDYVGVVDPRLNATYFGWVGSVNRTWDSKAGVYQIEVGFGNLYVGAGVDLPFDPSYPNPTSPGEAGGYPSAVSLTLDQIPDGPVNYRRIAFGDVTSAGHLLLLAAIQDTSHRTVTDVQITAINEAFDFLIDKEPKYGLNIYARDPALGNIPNVRFTPAGIQGMFNGLEQFAISSVDGKAYAQAGNTILDRNGITVANQMQFYDASIGIGNQVIISYLNTAVVSGSNVLNRTPHTNNIPLGTNAPGGFYSVQGLFTATDRFFGPYGVGGGVATLWFVTRNQAQQTIFTLYAPFDDGVASLGDLNHRWNNVRSINLYAHGTLQIPDTGTAFMHQLVPINGPNSGDIGQANRFWLNIRGQNISSNRITIIGVNGAMVPESPNVALLGTFEIRFGEVHSQTGFFENVVVVGPPGAGNGPNIGLFPRVSNGAYLGNDVRYWERLYAGDVRWRTTLSQFHDEDDVALVQQLHESLRTGSEVKAPVQVVADDGWNDLSLTNGLLVGAVAQLSKRVEQLEETLYANTGDAERHQDGPGGHVN
jgi:hypothetical protein